MSDQRGLGEFAKVVGDALESQGEALGYLARMEAENSRKLDELARTVTGAAGEFADQHGKREAAEKKMQRTLDLILGHVQSLTRRQTKTEEDMGAVQAAIIRLETGSHESDEPPPNGNGNGHGHGA